MQMAACSDEAGATLFSAGKQMRSLNVFSLASLLHGALVYRIGRAQLSLSNHA
jgi:hypothetical protein